MHCVKNVHSGPFEEKAGFSKPLIKNSRPIFSHCLFRVSGIAAVSGDGLLFEVIQGLFSRSDSSGFDPRSVPLGIVAGGSGNGLARSLVNEAGHAYVDNGVVSSSVRLAVSARHRPMDLAEIQILSTDGGVKEI